MSQNCYIQPREGSKVNFFPKIVNHTSGGEIHVNVPPVEVRLFRDVSFVFGSNFLRFSDNKVFHQKICRSESIFSDLGDQDLLARRDNKYRLRKYEKKIHLETVFHVTGSFSAHWAHFLAEYFPRMEYLKVLNAQDKKIDIVVFEQTDPHIMAVINEVVSNYSFVRITEVAKDVEVCCSALYFVSNDTFIADTSSVLSPLSVLVSDSSARYLHEFGQNSVQKIKLNKKLTRIFIGRSGRRNLINYKECLDFLINWVLLKFFRIDYPIAKS